MSTLSEKERQELSLLLPWYANGTLDTKDSRKVEAALARDEALAREFDLVLEDQAAVIELVSEEEVPISLAERFTAALNATQPEPAKNAKPRDTGESVIGRLLSSLFPARAPAYAYAMALIVMLLPAVAVVSYMAGSQQTDQYHTASGDEEAAGQKARMLVKFNADVTWTDIDAFLREYRGQVVKGPSADGLYELEFEKTEKLVEKMAAEIGVFEFAFPAN
jgi:anti-sigma factor RsiW